MKVSGESTQNTDHRFISSPKEELLYEIKSPQQQSVEPFFLLYIRVFCCLHFSPISFLNLQFFNNNNNNKKPYTSL